MVICSCFILLIFALTFLPPCCVVISIFADDESVAAVSSDLGTCYYNSGKYELATLLFRDALRIKSLSEDEENLEVADMLYKIASCHDSLCEYDEGNLFYFFLFFE